MKRRSQSGDGNPASHHDGNKEENTSKKAKPGAEPASNDAAASAPDWAGGFWMETKGDPKVRARLAREREMAKRQQEEVEQRKLQEVEQRRAEDALARQVASFIPVVPGTELSTITVSAYRIIPLLPFAPPSPKVHTMLVRMKPNERLCFHGRVHVRVFEGCAQVFGHHFHASAEFHTLLSPFTSGALFIDAVAPTEAMVKMKEERDKLQSSRAQSSSSSSAPSLSSSSSPVPGHVMPAQLNPAHSVLDEDIRNVLARKRAQENPGGEREIETSETVLVLRSFYEEASKKQKSQAQAQLSGMAPASLPISPSSTTLRESAAHRYFVLDLKEAEARQPLKLRIAPPVAEEGSGESDSDSDDEAEGATSGSKEDRDKERGDTQSEAAVEGGAEGASGDKAMEVVLDSQPTTATTTATTVTATATTATATATATATTTSTAAASTENRIKDKPESEAVEGEQRVDRAQQAATSSTGSSLLSQQTVDELVSHYLRIPGFYADAAMQIPRAWAPLANSFVPIAAADGDSQRPMDVEAESAHPPTEPAPRVVITGRKGMGKSTISQYLLNSLLNRYTHVVYLDTDLGQPEFTPAGLVSLHVISSPVFGPSFMHLASPLKAYFMGDVSVDEVFETYSQANRSHTNELVQMRMLVDYYYTAMLPDTDIPLSRLPLIVNTHGWLKGLGFEVLRNLISYLGPDVAVHLYPTPLEHTTQGPDFPFVEEEVGYRFRAVHLLPAVTPKRPRALLGPDDLRRLRLDAYFDCWSEGSLVTQIPYRVPWNAIRLALADADVPPSECLLAFNASLVGLCVDTADYLSCAPPGQADLSRGQSIYPSFLLSAPRCECVGLGIVRTIDPVTHQFLVLTSVPPERLQRVNTFVKGAIHLPAPTLLRGGWLSNPYLMAEAISRPGGAKMTGRSNIQRKHTASGPGRK